VQQRSCAPLVARHVQHRQVALPCRFLYRPLHNLPLPFHNLCSCVYLFGGEGAPRGPVDEDSALYVLDCKVPLCAARMLMAAVAVTTSS
jgi:hypothetical protein